MRAPGLSKLGGMLGAVYAVFIYCFIFLPVAVLVLFSFQDGTLPIAPVRGASLRWYQSIVMDERVMRALTHSVTVAIVSSLVATLLGYLSAYGFARYAPRYSRAMQWMLMAPLSVSYLIIGIGLLVTFNAVGVPKSLTAVGIGHVVINLPLAFAILYSQMGEHQANIERAARDLGAAEWQVLVRVSGPMLWPALLAAFCLCVTLSWDEFIIALLVSRFDVTLPVEIWSMLRTGLNPATNAVGTLVFAVSMVLVIVVELTLSRRRRRHEAG